MQNPEREDHTGPLQDPAGPGDCRGHRWHYTRPLSDGPWLMLLQISINKYGVFSHWIPLVFPTPPSKSLLSTPYYTQILYTCICSCPSSPLSSFTWRFP